MAESRRAPRRPHGGAGLYEKGVIGVLAFAAAAAVSAYLGLEIARGRLSLADRRARTLIKLAAWLAVIAVAFTAKLFPLAFMMLVAAGGVFAIEYWRERVIADADRTAPGAGIAAAPPSEAEAAAVLGVAPDADAEAIRAAHKRLISQLHPDKGGSDYLAAKINAARAALLARRGESSGE